MQIAPDKYKVEVEDESSDFDFLKTDETRPARQARQAESERSQNGAAQRTRSNGTRAHRGKSDNKPFPKIRKPVPVEESGAIRAPKAGDPVAPPPPLTDGIRPVDAPSQRSNGTSRDPLDFDKLDLGLGDDDWPNSEQWVDRSGRSAPEFIDEGQKSPLRKMGYVLGFMLVAAGLAAAFYTLPAAQKWLGNASPANAEGQSAGSTATEDNEFVIPGASSADQLGQNALPAGNVSLGEQFATELATLEALMQRDEFAEVEARLQSMDRSLYGYGEPEFLQIKELIANGPAAADETAELLAAEQQALAERVAAEQAAAAAQAAKQAAAEQAAEEQAAEEQAAAEQAAAEQAAAEQAAAEQAAADKLAEAEQLRADRISQEKARQEQLEIARQQRQAQQQLSQQAAAEAAYQPREWQPVGSAGENDSRSIEQIAAAQREAARQQRLIDARQRAQGQSATPESTLALAEIPQLAETPVVETPSSEQTSQVAPAADSLASPVQSQPISDSDLQLVYGQFSRLIDAIESQDVGTMLSLTERSGLRIQQFLQVFENNVSVDAQLRNVSMLDSTGEIQGILNITRLERADGSITGPPLNLSSVRLSAVRDGNGWSAIRW